MSLAIYKNGKLTALRPLSDVGGGPGRLGKTVLNLPAGQWNSVRLFGSVEQKQILAESDLIEFVGYYPDGKRFACEIDPQRAEYKYYSLAHAQPRSRWQRLLRRFR